jgi:hypothetical protein
MKSGGADLRPRQIFRDRWIVIALVAAALLPFLSSLLFDFVYDDRWIVRGNEAIRGWSALATLWTKPYWATNHHAAGAGLYRPLLMVMFSLLWNTGLRFPIWFHLLAVAAHVGATVLVWRLVRRIVAPSGALICTLWFAVHPVHIEAVANISNCSEVLVTLAVIGLTLVVLRADARLPSGDRASWKTAAVVALLYAAALLTKESGVTAPVLALLVVWGCGTRHPAGRGVRQAVPWLASRWIRVFGTCAATLTSVVVVRHAVLGALVSGGSIAATGLETLSGVQRVWAMLALGPRIIGLLVWPRVLNPYYSPRVLTGHTGPSAAAVLFVALAAATVGAAIYFARRGDRRYLVAIGWSAIAFFPASNLVIATGQIMAERTLYLPSVGAAMLVGVLAERVIAWTRGRRPALRRALTLAGSTAVAAALLIAAVSTGTRVRVWRNHDALFRQIIAADPGDYHGYWFLGSYLEERGVRAEGLAMLDTAYALSGSQDRTLQVDFANALLGAGQPPRAASVASGLMRSAELRRDPGAVALYLGSLGRAYGADSVLAAGERLYAVAPLPTTALFVGSAQEKRGELAAARKTFLAGLALASTDSAGVRSLRVRLAATPVPP